MALDLGTLIATLVVEDDRFIQSLRNDERQLGNFEQVVRQATGRVESSFRDSVRQVDNLGTSAQNTSRDVGRVGQSANDVGRVGDEARRADREVEQLGRTSERTARQTDQIGDGLRDRLDDAFNGAEDTAGESGGAGGTNFLGGFTSKLGDLGGKGGPIAGALVGIAAVGMFAGKQLADAIAEGMAADAASDQIQAQLGVDEATMRTLAQASGGAFANVFGESVQANMESGRDLFDFGLIDASTPAAEVQSAIEKVSTLNSMLGSETPDTLRAISGLVRSGLATDITNAADLMAHARTQGLDVQGDMIDSLSEYSAGWEKTGFSAEYTLSMIGQLMDNGVDNMDRGSDAFREFGRRIYEEGDTIKGTLGDLNLDTDGLFDAFKRGGPDAEAAFDQVFDAIRKIEDPTARATAAQQLLGDTAGDFIGAFEKLDPSEAVSKYGDSVGAVAQAADTMASNTQAKFDQIKNSVELSMSGIKLAVADGFGPSLDKLADWVNTHQPEILNFFAQTGDAIFVTLDAFLAFAEGSLRAGAMVADGFGSTFGEMLGLAGHVGETFGGIIKHIPGMQGAGEALEGIGRAAQNYSEGAHAAADKSRELADLIDGELRPGIQNAREDFGTATDAAIRTAEMTRALGDSVNAVPDGKNIVIDSNTPEQTRALQDLGLKVTEMPDGKFKITSNTDEGQRNIDDFVKANDGRRINVFTYNHMTEASAADARNYSNTGAGGRVPMADGGIIEKHDPQIGDGKTSRIWNEPETEGESYIPHAMSKRDRAEQILGITAEKFGFGLVKTFADGGIISKDGHDAMKAWAQSMDPVGYGMGGFSTSSIDCSGAVSGAINKALGLDAFDSRMSTVTEGAWLQSKGAILGKGPAGTVRVGWWDEGGGANGHTAMTFADDTNFESNGSEGVVVGGPTGADDPSFTDHAWFPNLGDLGLESDTGNGSTTPSTVTGGDGSSGDLAYATTESGALLATDGQRVFVTNWPSAMGGDEQKKPEDERVPILTAGLKVFANGGIDNLPAQAGIYQDGANVVGFAERGTGGEGYVPLSPAKRPRSVAITKEIASRFGYQLVPMADGGLTGFGGWQNDDRPTLDIPLDGRPQSAAKRRANANNALALFGGGLNTLLSGFDGDGKFTGQFDTGANSPAVLEKGVSAITEILQAQIEQLQEIAKAANNPTPVEVNVDIDQGNRSANIAITKRGL